MAAGLSIRGDSAYCPLCFSLDTYWECEPNCAHCYLRRMNRTWGRDLRPVNPEDLRKKLIAGMKATNPKSPLAWAIKNKNTIRFGNKSDPFQPAERIHKASEGALEVLEELGWTFIIQSHFTHIMEDYWGRLVRMGRRGDFLPMPVISPGAERDWEIFERKITSPVDHRLHFLRRFKRECPNADPGVNGEPFIPGYHTVEEFRDICKRLKSYGIRSYNTYFLHANDLVYKNFADLGLDIEKIWSMNRDEHWRPILHQLMNISVEMDITLGCPDFVNTGWKWRERNNTCCGLNVPNPCTFNTHTWKRLAQQGVSNDTIIETTWDGVGDLEFGGSILSGDTDSVFNFNDIQP